ncbi:site-specific integrase [Massilia aurea]
MNRYGLRIVDLGGGEKLPLLVDERTSVGVFEATAFSLHLRDRALKAKTIDSAMRAVQLLYEVLAETNVCLIERAEGNELLRLSEVIAVADRCKTRAEGHENLADGVISLANVRRKKGTFIHSKDDAVKPKTAVIRLHYIINFLSYFSTQARLQRLPNDGAKFLEATELTLKTLGSKKPVVSKTSDRQGLPKEAEARLFEVIHPDFAGNPWKSSFMRYRNHLIVKLLFGLGVRKGELCGIKLEDINFREGTIFIAKRTDDKDDRRGRPATTKTLPRLLSLNDEMRSLLLHYTEEVRPSRRRAEYNPYLLVSDEGNELALNSIDYIFSSFRQAFPEFVQISSHVLRHTINERFAEMCEGKDASLVKLIQNYLMGWEKSSKTAEIYTKGYVQGKAKEVLMALQQRVFK